MKISEIHENLFQIEKELNLFEQQIQGVYFWKIIRFDIFRGIGEKLGVLEQAHLESNKSFTDKVKKTLIRIKDTYLHSTIQRNSQVDVLLIEHGRKVLIENKYIDIYTEYKRNIFEKNKINFEIVDRAYLDNHYDIASKQRSYQEHTTISFLISKFLNKLVLTSSERELIKSIQKKLEKVFNLDFFLDEKVIKHINLFKIRYLQYKKMLIKRAVKKIYLVVSYGHEPLICAAQELRIECIEIQHGTMNRYHEGYSFPYNKKVPYFPDKIELFGKYWDDATPLPLKKDSIIYEGYPYLNIMLDKYKKIKKIKNQVVFISQGSIASGLSKVAVELAQDKDMEVYYKLHPGEFGRWKNDYKYFQDIKNTRNLHIVEDEIPLYEIIASSEFLIGVYSTAVFEGLKLNCKTILINLSGIELVQYLIDSKIALLANNVKDVKNYIQENDFPDIDSAYFFKDSLS